MSEEVGSQLGERQRREEVTLKQVKDALKELVFVVDSDWVDVAGVGVQQVEQGFGLAVELEEVRLVGCGGGFVVELFDVVQDFYENCLC